MLINYKIILVTAILGLISLIIIYFRNFISAKLKIVDVADDPRKIHTNPTPLVGGIACYVPYVLSLIATIVLHENNNLKSIVVIFLISSGIFLFGLLDDRNNLKASIKSIIIIVILYLFLPIDQNLIITQLEFDTLISNTVLLNQGSFFFTIFCLFLFFNAVNFSDGANGISSSLGIYWITILLFKSYNFNLIYLVLLISLVLVFLFNISEKIFLGNSGSNLISIIIGLLFINSYNTEKNFLCDEIFIYFFIPGLDMVRVTIERIIKKKSPLSADKSHLHHLLIGGINKNFVWIPYLFLSATPLLLMEVFNSSLISVAISTILFFGIIVFYKKKQSKKIKL